MLDKLKPCPRCYGKGTVKHEVVYNVYLNDDKFITEYNDYDNHAGLLTINGSDIVLSLTVESTRYLRELAEAERPFKLYFNSTPW